MKNFNVHIHLKDSSQTNLFQPHGVVELKLQCLEAAGIIEKVTYSEWAAPIVTVPKPNGQFRICGDY